MCGELNGPGRHPVRWHPGTLNLGQTVKGALVGWVSSSHEYT